MHSITEIHWDAVVYGAGYAGFAAASHLHRSGRQVLLVDRDAALLWESSRALQSACHSVDCRHWLDFHHELDRRGLAGEGYIDAASAEALAARQLLTMRLPTLFYARPVAVKTDETHVTAVAFAARGKVYWIYADRWLDVSETPALSGWIDPACRVPSVHARVHSLTLNQAVRGEGLPSDIALPDVPGLALATGPNHWPGENTIQWRSGGPECGLEHLPGLLRLLREQVGISCRDMFVSRVSSMPFTRYADGEARQLQPAANLIVAYPGACGYDEGSLSGRFASGVVLARELLRLPRPPRINPANPHKLPELLATEIVTADLAVAGAGTGGAVGAIAAGRIAGDGKIVCFDAMPFPGGVGTAAGIHSYFFGVPGGLQNEIDRRTRELAALFATPAQIRGYHPVAKKLTLLAMMREAGVKFIPSAALFDVTIHDRRVTRVSVATDCGVQWVDARLWLDGTGDGDLCRLAGAGFDKGRAYDGKLHIYSQCSELLRWDPDKQRFFQAMRFEDTGWVDSTDAVDLTRARLLGVSHCLREQADPLDRPVEIAPAVGIREGPHIHTDYILQLADLINHSTFADTIGYTGAHYDNHTVDLNP